MGGRKVVMSSQGEYYGVQRVGSKWVAMYDHAQGLMGERFDTEAEAWAFVRRDKERRAGRNPMSNPDVPMSREELHEMETLRDHLISQYQDGREG